MTARSATDSPEPDSTAPAKPLDIATVRARLAGKRGKAYWRSLDEVAGTPEFRQWVDDEFPNRSSLLALDRRNFLKFMGASLALAGLSGCRYLPQQKVIPFVNAPEDLIPGETLRYATALTLGGYATGVLVESHEGRPTKIEGNPAHPASLGATDAITQAALLTLYDPDRSQAITGPAGISSWEEFLAAARSAISGAGDQGASFRLLTGAITSPSLIGQIERLLKAYPKAEWIQYEPANRDSERLALLTAVGKDVTPSYHFDKADVVVAIDSDFLTSGPGAVRYAADFMGRRRVRKGQPSINRLYSVETVPSNTGATADHRLPVRASRLHSIVAALAAAVGSTPADPGVSLTDLERKWVDAAARDLMAHKGSAVIVPGTSAPADVQALAHLANLALDAQGSTVTYLEPTQSVPSGQVESLAQLVASMRSGAVKTLITIDCNPVYSAPADLDFAGAYAKVPFRAHMGLYADETAAASTWHINETHELEAWGDARAYDGTITIQQPLIQPLFTGRSPLELISTLAGADLASYDAVRAHWQQQRPGPDFGAFWDQAVCNGVVPGTAFAPVTVAASTRTLPIAKSGTGLELVLLPDPNIWDGRFANNGWLQELPRPITRLTWDNAFLISPATAQRLRVTTGDMIEVTVGGRKATGPVQVLPGLAPDTIAAHLGHGRTACGQVGEGVGFNAGTLSASTAPAFSEGAAIRKTGDRYAFAVTEHHHAITDGKIDGEHGRDIVRTGTLAQLVGEGVHKHEGEEPTLYERPKYDGYAWGMSVDLSVCTGCNACVAACTAENNIPVVGKDQVARGREMHWIRIDRYFEGNADAPEVHHMPVMCQHCEQAPCEPVCPVAATTHSKEGLNQMVYNRCVGTRYCSNNCPYKVRRFNFLNYANHFEVPVLDLVHNPNVTVRSRGVMEKCTLCVQRINAARIEAKKAGKPVADGDIQTACQSACPPKAIVFGNINDPSSAISKIREEPHGYALLEELNTRPRITYLARVRNPNPEIGG